MLHKTEYVTIQSYGVNTVTTGQEKYSNVKTFTQHPDWAKAKFESPKSVLPYTRFIADGAAYTRYKGKCRMIPIVRNPYALSYGPARWNLVVGHGADMTQTTMANFVNSNSEDLFNEIVTLLRDRMSRKKIDGLIELGELDKTLDMFHYRVRVMADFIEGFRQRKKQLYRTADNYLRTKVPISVGKPTRLDKQRTAQAYKQLIADLRDAYLEFFYGWQPLASGVTDALIASYEASYKRPPRLKVSAKAHKDFSVVSALYKQPGPSNMPKSCTHVRVTEWDITAWGGGLLMPRAKLRQPHSEAEIFGFDIGEVPYAVYNLIPSSFLLDYFSNLGDFIANLGDWMKDMSNGTMYYSIKATAKQYVDIRDVVVLDDYAYRRPIESLEVNPSVRNYMYFNRRPMSYGTWRVKLAIEKPSWLQLVNTVLVTRQGVKRWVL